MTSIHTFIADELAHKVKHLHIALEQANTIISVLEEENIRLKDAVTSLASLNNNDLNNVVEIQDDRLCTVQI